ncbi:MAG: FtsW/RodA/SpoVE family cell cycle protein [Lachnospiraceae bacterium]|nr:FtsW/RodA/SpoVE family cell cycle protein [Lachnospiraceae bacterium]
MLTILVLGLVMMFTASYPTAYYRQGNSYYYLTRQFIFACVGVAVMIGMSFFDYHHLHKLAVPILAAAVLLMIIVLLMPTDSNEPKRWLRLGLFSIQASEVCKFALILFFANWGSLYYKKMSTIKYGIMPAVAVLIPVILLLYLEPHYSGIVICVLIVAVMLFLSGLPIKYFLMAGGAVAAVVVVMAVTGNLGYAMSRLDGWGQALVYTTEDMWQNTYQTRNSLYAIGSGGLWGLGLGQSRQKYLFLPEPQNDFVFAVVCEEIGLVGALIILSIFALFVWRGFKICSKAKDRFGHLLGVGLMAQIGLQVVLNILVITDFLPNTGISLPFFSYGGSSLLMLLAQMGIVMNISRSSMLEKE